MERFHLIDFFPHFPVLNFFIVFLFLLILSTAIATLLYNLVERRGQQEGKKIIDAYEKTPTSEITTELKTW